MTKAYMGDAGGRTIGAASQWSRRNAIREAARIVAETEPDVRMGYDEIGTFYRPADLLGFGPLGQALAESIAAVLPVLDELAGDATTDAMEACDRAGIDYTPFAASWDRNRATLAAMDVRQ